MTNAKLNLRVDKLEKQVEAGRRTDLIQSISIAKTDYLNQLVKSYDKNVKIVGLTYDIKDSRTYNKKSYEVWCVKVVTAALISTKVVEEGDVLVNVNGDKSLIRAVISNVHPLSGRNNAAVVIAFNEASFAQQIKEMVRKDRGLSMGRIRIHIHLPPILDALHNAALKARKEMLEKSKAEGRNRRIHCNVTLSHPWVHLVEASDSGFKMPIPFMVEDGRLADPANTLALMAIKGDTQSFKPYKYLTEEVKADIYKNVVVNPRLTAPPPPAPAVVPAPSSSPASTDEPDQSLAMQQ